jgi:hypothetical protein
VSYTNPNLIAFLAGCTVSGLGSESDGCVIHTPMTVLAGQLLSGRNLPFAFPPRVRLPARDEPQVSSATASEGDLRWVWESHYGSILIEVVGNEAYVNGERVERHAE